MQFREMPLPGAFEVLLESYKDERGFFARLWCVQEFAAAGLPTRFVQASVSHNEQAGTLRGMHFQCPPSQEGKLVRCESGSVHDVLLDLRPDSPAFLSHVAVVLSATRGNAVYIPPGIAHGFQTLEDHSRVGYVMTDFYAPSLADGVRHDDPAFGIAWPRPVSVISQKDCEWPPFDPAEHQRRYRQAAQ
jgi:dTDP-4-dehydrorhamnose 3,5-epimerase